MRWNRWVVLAACAYATVGAVSAQTVSQCMQSFAGFDPSRVATSPLRDRSVSCGDVEALRLQLIPSEQEQQQLGLIEARLDRIKSGLQEAQTMLEREERELVGGEWATRLAKVATATAVIDVAINCGNLNVLRCSVAASKLDRRLNRLIDRYSAEGSARIFRDSSKQLIEVLGGQLEAAEGEYDEVVGRTDLFVATCVIIESQCLRPPPTRLP